VTVNDCRGFYVPILSYSSTLVRNVLSSRLLKVKYVVCRPDNRQNLSENQAVNMKIFHTQVNSYRNVCV
jgi:hypothetical protein